MKISLYGDDTLEAAVADLEGMLRKVNPPDASWNWLLHLFLLVAFFGRLQDVSNVSSSAPVQGRALKAEEYLMPVAQVWKNLKHRDGTIYLAYRTLKNFS